MASVFPLHRPGEAVAVARSIIQDHPHARVFALHGDLGVGKTTLIKAFCQVLGVADQTTSPSFAIVNEYQAANGEPVYHFDLYRLKNTAELEAIGFTEYVDSGHYCFIEWPELAEELLPPDTHHLRFALQPDGARMITVEAR